MGKVKLCVYQRASEPFLLEVTGIHLYSIEELAYYLYHNIVLLDDKILGEKLYQWLEKEVGMKELAQQLRRDENAAEVMYVQVIHILQASELYSEEELQKFLEKMKMLSKLRTQERMKYRADELLKQENYWAAAIEYEKILRIRQSSRLSVEFYANVWNNLGVSYASVFLFEKAAFCFENAFQFYKLQEYQKKAEYARKLSNYGKNNAEELLNYKISEEMKKETEVMLKNLETESRSSNDGVSFEQFLKAQEQNYQKNACI